jgi:heptosyltransferase-2
MLALADAAPGSFAPRLYPTASDQAAADGFLTAADIRDGFVALAPGSIWGSKRWPYYAELAARLAPDACIVVVGGPEDASLGANVVAAVNGAGGRAVNAAGVLPLRQSVALIGRAQLLVANDSAPVHFASAVGTRVLALFGPTIPEFGFAPSGARDAALGVTGLSCRPCSRHGPPQCPLGHHRCMKELSVETVVNEIGSLRALRRRD